MASSDREAAAAFVRRYQRRVFGLAFAIVGDRDAASDVAQEAFVRVLAACRRVRRPAWQRVDVAADDHPQPRRGRGPGSAGDAVDPVDVGDNGRAGRASRCRAEMSCCRRSFTSAGGGRQAPRRAAPCLAVGRVRAVGPRDQRARRHAAGDGEDEDPHGAAASALVAGGGRWLRRLHRDAGAGVRGGNWRGAGRGAGAGPGSRRLLRRVPGVPRRAVVAVDDVVALTPEAEPPSGFESAVLDRLDEGLAARRRGAVSPGGGCPGRRRRGRGVHCRAVPAVSCTSPGVTTASWREAVRRTLAVAGGVYFVAFPSSTVTAANRVSCSATRASRRGSC